jgi:hypothetical protein
MHARPDLHAQRSHRVGIVMAASALRTSISNHCRAIAAAVAGLADIRCICAYQLRKSASPALLGMVKSRSAPVPQWVKIVSATISVKAWSTPSG